MASDGVMPRISGALSEVAFAERLRQCSVPLREQLSSLLALNSLYPTTQAFLKACGVTQVSELSKNQMADLKAYLHMRLGR